MIDKGFWNLGIQWSLIFFLENFSDLTDNVNFQTDTSISQDAATKFRDRHEKLKEEVQKTKVDYQKTLTNLNEYKWVEKDVCFDSER